MTANCDYVALANLGCRGPSTSRCPGHPRSGVLTTPSRALSLTLRSGIQTSWPLLLRFPQLRWRAQGGGGNFGQDSCGVCRSPSDSTVTISTGTTASALRYLSKPCDDGLFGVSEKPYPKTRLSPTWLTSDTSSYHLAAPCFVLTCLFSPTPPFLGNTLFAYSFSATYSAFPLCWTSPTFALFDEERTFWIGYPFPLVTHYSFLSPDPLLKLLFVVHCRVILSLAKLALSL